MIMKEKTEMVASSLSIRYHLKCNMIKKQLRKKKRNQKKPK